MQGVKDTCLIIQNQNRNFKTICLKHIGGVCNGPLDAAGIIEAGTNKDDMFFMIYQ